MIEKVTWGCAVFPSKKDYPKEAVYAAVLRLSN